MPALMMSPGCNTSTPAGLPVRAYDESYHAGATNTIHTGPDHPSYIQLPLVPMARE